MTREVTNDSIKIAGLMVGMFVGGMVVAVLIGTVIFRNFKGGK